MTAPDDYALAKNLQVVLANTIQSPHWNTASDHIVNPIPDPMSDPRVVALVMAAKAIGRWNVKNLPKTAAYDELCALDDALSAITKEQTHER